MTMKYAHLPLSYKLDVVWKLDSFGAGGVVSLLKRDDTKADAGENSGLQDRGKSMKVSNMGR